MARYSKEFVNDEDGWRVTIDEESYPYTQVFLANERTADELIKAAARCAPLTPDTLSLLIMAAEHTPNLLPSYGEHPSDPVRGDHAQ